MKKAYELLKKNKAWAASMVQKDPAFFSALAKVQTPEYLWIGCGDSRVPANELTGLLPGEVFVHRNISNVVVQTDLNCLSVIQFAVEALKVEHIIVCGHYGCGGVAAALGTKKNGLLDNWLRHVQAVKRLHQTELDALDTQEERHDRLCELNVQEQVANVARTTIVTNAWENGQKLAVHGWIYGLKDGLLRDLDVSVNSPVD